jgi:N-[(2S)-2-amino-2-carboxyethyl]-L-glutamate dehydrogenase
MSEQTPGQRANGLGFSVITGRTIWNLLRDEVETCIATVREAYLAHADGKSVNPPSVFLRFPDKPSARIIGLPTHLEKPWQVSGIKWIASYPDNARRHIPRASAVLIINNDETGYPLACMEGSIISAVRTAASAALAASELSANGREAAALGIVGTGYIARYVHRFLLGHGWNIGRLRLYDIDEEQAQRFATRARIAGQHDAVDVARSLEEAVRESDLVLFTTVAGTPHVRDAALLRHNPLVLHLSLRDLAPELVLHANNIVDDVDHVMSAGTSLHLAEQDVGHRNFVTGTLSDVMRGDCAVAAGQPTIFSPFGLGVLDLAIGKMVYDRAIAAGSDLQVEEFFYDLER